MRKRSVMLQIAMWGLSCLVLLLIPTASQAIPAFARQYQTSCTTCHSDFPKLNDFGKAFKDAGFKFPADDETFLKVPPVMLGAPAQKDLFPRAVWPGTIPGMPPIGLRMNTFFQTTSGNRGKFDSLSAPGTVNPFIPKTDFSSGLFSLFTAGNFGSDIAFWVDEDISVAGDNASGGLGDGYLKFVNIGRLIKMPKDALSLRVGRFELDLPFSPARSHNISGWDIFDQNNLGAVNPAFTAQHNVNNQLTMADAMNGIEFSGGHQYGGYHYSIALVDQNTSGVSQAANGSAFVPSPAGFASDSNFKDIYARFSYRFNLERDPASRNAVQAAGSTGPRDHTYVNLGTFWFYGRSVQRFSGENLAGDPVVLTAREPFYRAGGDFSVNYRNFNVYGLFMYGHDHNLLPVDDTGALVPLPITGVTSPTVGFIRGTPATFTGGFVQADYLIHPWLMAIMRWDAVNSGPDRLNGLAGSADTPFVLPFHQTRNRVTPGVQFLIHANIKASFEYQFRPQQFVQVVTNPITGLPTAVNPFRTNTAVTALEWVF